MPEHILVWSTLASSLLGIFKLIINDKMFALQRNANENPDRDKLKDIADLQAIFTPKWAHYAIDQKFSVFLVCSALSLTLGRPWEFSFRVETRKGVLQATIEFADGSFAAQRPIFFWFSTIGPLGGVGPRTLKQRDKFHINLPRRTRYIMLIWLT